ncbi:hypothetical protein NR800_17780 [Corallococcus interemptor]|uniref:hypothetical protein n=1 Tax=Corallococcus TaxID=83461 RepID=UPI001CC1B33E|nr:hypothetical protein [Corallococcus sp. AS-1-6]
MGMPLWLQAGLWGFAPEVVAGTTAVAAGAILAMLADTMMPEATEGAHDLTGLITVAGFLAAFVLSKLGDEREGLAGRAVSANSR